MKSYSNLIYLRSLFLIMVMAQLASCSWIGSKRSLFGSDDNEESEEQSALPSVPRSQFDSLNKKYEKLLKERQMEKVEGSQASQMMNQMESRGDSSLIISDLEKVKNSDLAETVDVFAQNNNLKSKKSHQGQGVSMPLSFKGGLKYQSPAMVEEHIDKIRKAESLVSANKFDSALSMIKELEKSPIRQIVVRAKFLLGEVLFKQGEYDLSMQVFEEVLEQYAFSGLVIKTLGRLIVCSDKLKISAKQEKYYSILHDFFEQGS